MDVVEDRDRKDEEHRKQRKIGEVFACEGSRCMRTLITSGNIRKFACFN